MNRDEFDSIFDITESINDDAIKFNRVFRDEAFELSQGYPYYAQLFGQLALDEFVKVNGIEGRGTINSTYLKSGLNYLMENEPQMESAYQDLINNNEQREIMLQGISKQTSAKQRRSDIYNYCQKRGVSNPKSILTYLLGQKINVNGVGENVLVKHGKDHISFLNPLFKVFVKTREPIFELD